MSAPVVSVIGGGQLARMMQAQAVALDIHLRVLVEGPDVASAQVTPDSPVGDPRDASAVRALVDGAAVLTFEHEHVPHGLLAALEAEGVTVRPGAEALRHAQDKLTMRRRLTDAGVPCPAWTAARTLEDVRAFGADHGWPVVVKTARGGYDGKGVHVVHSAEQVTSDATVRAWIERLGDESAATGSGAADALLVEAHVPFTRELAALVARRPSGGPDGRGEVRCWPVVETIQENGVCAVVLAPAPDMPAALHRRCTQIATTVARELDVTGVLAVELFEVDGPDGPQVLVNELAMRPHNSGHWTIDGSVTSQFEQHLRAVLDWPLGRTTPTAPACAMVNLLGSDLDDPHEAYPRVMERYPDAKVHLYGKEVRPGRKLGHVTVAGPDLAVARERAAGAVALLGGQE